ncbi:conserved protein, unknown function, partial [Hepatocystis sp. ex Piliocolobus tephrosceles]
VEDVENIKGVKGVEDVEDVEDVEGVKDIKYVEDVENIKGVKGVENIKGVEDVENIKGVKDIKYVEDVENIKGVKDIKYVEDVENIKGVKGVKGVKDIKYVEDVEDVNKVIIKYAKNEFLHFSPFDIVIMLKYILKTNNNINFIEFKKSLSYIQNNFVSTYGLKKKTNYDQYSVIDTCTLILTILKYRRNDNSFIEHVTNYILQNIDKISSKMLIEISIHMYMYKKENSKNGAEIKSENGKENKNEGNGNRKSKKMLEVIMDVYKPSSDYLFLYKQKKKKNKMNSFFLKKHKLKYSSRKKNQKKCIIEKKFAQLTHVDNYNNNSSHDIYKEKLYRKFDKVKIKKMLLYLKILIDHNIYIDDDWRNYFLSLILDKFFFRKKKKNKIKKRSVVAVAPPPPSSPLLMTERTNNFHLLCYILYHLKSKSILMQFFFLCYKYKIYSKKFIEKNIYTCNNLSQLIHIALFFSSHLYTNNNIKLFNILFYKILFLYYDMSHYSNKHLHQLNKEKNMTSHNKTLPHTITNTHSSLPSLSYNGGYTNVENTNQSSLYQHELKIYERMKNNKYEKKKETKKKRNFINKIKQIKIQTCEQLIQNSFLKLPTNTKWNKIYNSNNGLYIEITGNEKLNTYPNDYVYNYTSICDKYPTVNTKQIVIMDEYDTKCDEKIYKNGCRNSSDTCSDSHDNKNKNNYFENLQNARNILLLIYNYIIFQNKNLNYGQNKRSDNYHIIHLQLNKLTYKQLILLYNTYTLCCTYIGVASNINYIMNNNKNVFSSKFHKQVLSIISQLANKKVKKKKKMTKKNDKKK